MNAQLYEAIKDMAKKITELDDFYGVYALRKVNAVSAESDLAILLQVADDLSLIIGKVGARVK